MCRRTTRKPSIGSDAQLTKTTTTVGRWLSLMYRDGNGVPQDHVRSYLWENLAAEQEGQTRLSRRDAAEFRDFSKNRLTPAGFAEAEKLAAGLEVGAACRSAS